MWHTCPPQATHGKSDDTVRDTHSENLGSAGNAVVAGTAVPGNGLLLPSWCEFVRGRDNLVRLDFSLLFARRVGDRKSVV